jgi:glycosyltransferase involved in cell wall biosynthesis
MKIQPHPLVFIGGTSEPGGLHVHTADVAVAAAYAGHPVTILCPSVDHFSALLAGTPVQVEVIPPRTAQQSTLRYWRQHLARHRRAHAVFCRGKLAESSIADLIGIRLATRRLYTIEHRADFPDPGAVASLRDHGRAMRWLVHRTLAVSEEITHSALHSLGLPPRGVATCLNWFDPLFQPVTPDQRRQAKLNLGLSPDHLVVGYHGRLAPEKRLPTLIDAFARLHPPAGVTLNLVLVGDGWKRRELEECIRARDLAPRTVLTGWHPDPRAALAAFDISVLPSLAEGFPLGLLEAMASGAACLAHPMSSTRQIIPSHTTGLLADLNDPASFTAALQKLVDLAPAQRLAMGEAAARITADQYARDRRLPDVLRALDLDPAAGRLPARDRTLVFAR